MGGSGSGGVGCQQMECVLDQEPRPTLTSRAEEVDPSLTEPLTSQDDTGTPGHLLAGVGLVALASGDETHETEPIGDVSPHFEKLTTDSASMINNWLLFYELESSDVHRRIESI